MADFFLNWLQNAGIVFGVIVFLVSLRMIASMLGSESPMPTFKETVKDRECRMFFWLVVVLTISLSFVLVMFRG